MSFKSTLFWAALQLFATELLLARNCAYFFYAGTPTPVDKYSASFITKVMPDDILPEIPRPIPQGADVLREWSEQAAECLLNAQNGILTAFDSTRNLDRLRVLLAEKKLLNTPYDEDSFFEKRRINRALQDNSARFQAQVKISESPKIVYLRETMVSSCTHFSSVMTTTDIILAQRLPIATRQKYIREFCRVEEKAEREENLAKLQKLALKCRESASEECILQDVYDYIDCSQIEDFLSKDMETLFRKFDQMKSSIAQSQEVCRDNIEEMLTGCLELGIDKGTCQIPDAPGNTCAVLGVDSSWCLQGTR
jgi:hypothetical protein